ncbi:hypothetical protein CLOACE_12130 [Clostridium acetireducens DSM 10703]|jgi:hypothetical protein|uniref:Uncharacterized protein n=1 Tax=Clostridium acetireducens DSM 10703 TaxID=1121290 RepID=A0A1E8EYT5_9CLOT|nr:CLC_0170 family protein [Clostridium acetireducens]OFI06180.1 hypothetical protein CLOACE_12130 [Clostridium acetireducens DSM 10703]
MKIIIKLFSLYLLILIIIEGSILTFIDARNFEKSNMKDVAKKSRVIGILYIVITLVLTVISKFMI